MLSQKGITRNYFVLFWDNGHHTNSMIVVDHYHNHAVSGTLLKAGFLEIGHDGHKIQAISRQYLNFEIDILLKSRYFRVYFFSQISKQTA